MLLNAVLVSPLWTVTGTSPKQSTQLAIELKETGQVGISFAKSKMLI